MCVSLRAREPQRLTLKFSLQFLVKRELVNSRRSTAASNELIYSGVKQSQPPPFPLSFIHAEFITCLTRLSGMGFILYRSSLKRAEDVNESLQL